MIFEHKLKKNEKRENEKIKNVSCDCIQFDK